MVRGLQYDMVDGLSSSVAIKGPCAVSTTANVTLSGEQTIDGVLTDESRVLVRNQTVPAENGIYVTSTGDWRRAKDFSRNDDVVKGTAVYVSAGATGSGLWVLTTANPIVFDTSSLTFSNINALLGGGLLSTNNLSDLASAIAGWDALARYVATNVAPSAGVLDLSTLTAPIANVQTGTGAASSITLGNGKVRLLRVDTALTLTAGASLVVQGKAAGSFIFKAETLLMVVAAATGAIVRVFVVDENRDAKGTAIASAATITLGRDHLYHITGSTGPITDIDWSDAIDGAWAWLVFDSTPTVQHNATTLQLPGGASIPAAAGDRMLVIQDSGDNAICLFYVKASGGVIASASAANFLANTNNGLALVAPAVWSSADTVALTDAATIAVDMSTFINGSVTLAGNRTLGQPSNTKNNQCGVICIKQDATGSRTLAYHNDWEFSGGTAPVLSTAANAEDLLFYQVLAANRIFGSLVKAVS